MSSARKILSARANGAKSRGPITPAGRHVASMNALGHGLNANTLVLDTESREDYQAMLDSYFDEFLPEGPTETELVRRLADAAWRTHRYDGVETGTLDFEIDRQAEHVDKEYEALEPHERLSLAFKSLVNNSKTLEILNRYALRDQRAYDRTLKLLLERQAARKRSPRPQIQNSQNEPNPANEHTPILEPTGPTDPRVSDS